MTAPRTLPDVQVLPPGRGQSLAGMPFVKQQNRSVVDPLAAGLDRAAADMLKAERRTPESAVLTMAGADTSDRSAVAEVPVMAEGTGAPEAPVLVAERKLEAPPVETRMVGAVPVLVEQRGGPVAPPLLAAQLRDQRKGYRTDHSLALRWRVLFACTRC